MWYVQVLPALLLFVRLLGPKEPHNDHDGFQTRRRPQSPQDAHRRVRKDTAQDRAGEQQQRGGGPAVALDVAGGKEVLVGKEVAVDAGEDDAGEGVVLEGAAGDGLAAALKGDEGEGQQDGPVDGVVAGGGGREGDDEGGGDSEEGLGGKGGAEDPAALGGEEAVEAGEEEGADAKGEEGDAGAVEAGADGGVYEGRDAEGDVDGVSCRMSEVQVEKKRSPIGNFWMSAATCLTCLHRHKGSPYLRRGAVQQAGDYIAEEQHEIGP